ncbi:MAG: HD domain-containing protein [Amoebophilaceae bacterium]|nr:HD domain-containing protein [Amoebophilaceae bacterium]
MRLLWPLLLYGVLMVSGKAFMVLGDYSPMVCFLFLLHVMVALSLLSWKMVVAMLVLVIYMPNRLFMLPPVNGWAVLYSSWHGASHATWVPLATLSALLCAIYYRYANRRLAQALTQVKLLQESEDEILLDAIMHQKFYEQQIPEEGSRALYKIEQELTAMLKENALSNVKETLWFAIEKLKGFKEFLLTKAYEGRYTIELDKKAMTYTRLDAVILKLRQSMESLDPSTKLLIRYHTTIEGIWVDEKKFYRLLLTNIFVLGKACEADRMVVLTITDATLEYLYHIPSDQVEPTRFVPALAFHITHKCPQAETPAVYPIDLNVMPYDDLKTTDMTALAAYESIRIVDAHGGYSTVTLLDRLYVLPINGKQVVRGKTYKPEHLFMHVVETKESLALEQQLKRLLAKETALPSDLIHETIQFIKKAHGHTMRKSGDPYYMHPMAATQFLLKETNDPETVLATLLHDIVEDTQIPLSYLTALYGPTVAGIIDGVTHLCSGIRRWQLTKEEEHAKIIAIGKKDIRVLQVKLADRLHNVTTLSCRSIADQKRIAKETVDFYIRIAEEVGVGGNYLVPTLKKLCGKILAEGR